MVSAASPAASESSLFVSFRIVMLNAFRHHWNLHLHTRGLVLLRPPVLNAFRHHWNLHLANQRNHAQKVQVLNAFRHHWNLHYLEELEPQHAATCSTPFGIIGIFTAGKLFLNTRLPGAQRLFALLESSP